MASKSPIRVAMVGLSADATGSGWAASAHLPYLRASPHYRITGLLNSTVDAARKSIAKYELPSETKAYGSPGELAEDPDVDLVVVNVRVDKHATVLLPILPSGKSVLCEWPVERNGTVAAEVEEAASRSGSKVLLGLQARMSPVAAAVKKTIDEGKIGKVLSSTLVGSLGMGGGVAPAGFDVFMKRSVGANLVSIHFGHLIDMVFHILGEPTQISSSLAIGYPEVRLLDLSTTPPTQTGTATNENPDQIALSAILASGGVLSLHLRGGDPMPETSSSKDGTGSSMPPFLWRIYGEKGEIEVTAPNVLVSIGGPGAAIKLHDHSSGKVHEVPMEGDETLDALPVPARNVGRLYDAFAAGGYGKDERIVTIQQGMGRHRLIDEMLKRFDEGKQGWVLEK